MNRNIESLVLLSMVDRRIFPSLLVLIVACGQPTADADIVFPALSAFFQGTWPDHPNS